MTWQILGWFCNHGGQIHYGGTGHTCIQCGNNSGPAGWWIAATESKAVIDTINILNVHNISLQTQLTDAKTQIENLKGANTILQSDNNALKAENDILKSAVSNIPNTSNSLNIMNYSVKNVGHKTEELENTILEMKQKAKEMLSKYVRGEFYLDPIFL